MLYSKGARKAPFLLEIVFGAAGSGKSDQSATHSPSLRAEGKAIQRMHLGFWIASAAKPPRTQ
jgi:hypothetical protein